FQFLVQEILKFLLRHHPNQYYLKEFSILLHWTLLQDQDNLFRIDIIFVDNLLVHYHSTQILLQRHHNPNRIQNYLKPNLFFLYIHTNKTNLLDTIQMIRILLFWLLPPLMLLGNSSFILMVRSNNNHLDLNIEDSKHRFLQYTFLFLLSHRN